MNEYMNDGVGYWPGSPILLLQGTLSHSVYLIMYIAYMPIYLMGTYLYAYLFILSVPSVYIYIYIIYIYTSADLSIESTE